MWLCHTHQRADKVEHFKRYDNECFWTLKYKHYFFSLIAKIVNFFSVVSQLAPIFFYDRKERIDERENLKDSNKLTLCVRFFFLPVVMDMWAKHLWRQQQRSIHIIPVRKSWWAEITVTSTRQCGMDQIESAEERKFKLRRFSIARRCIVELFTTMKRKKNYDFFSCSDFVSCFFTCSSTVYIRRARDIIEETCERVNVRGLEILLCISCYFVSRIHNVCLHGDCSSGRINNIFLMMKLFSLFFYWWKLENRWGRPRISNRIGKIFSEQFHEDAI